jgi:hypothetical protein
VNGILTAARVSALFDLMLHPHNGSWTTEEWVDQAVLRALNETAQTLEDAVAQNRIQVVNQVPKAN